MVVEGLIDSSLKKLLFSPDIEIPTYNRRCNVSFLRLFEGSRLETIRPPRQLTGTVISKLITNPHVKGVDLTGNATFADNTNEFRAITDAIPLNPGLRRLVLDSCCLDNVSIQNLCHGLSNTTLQSLSVSDNQFGWSGFRALLAVLQRNESITNMDLSGSSLVATSEEETEMAPSSSVNETGLDGKICHSIRTALRCNNKLQTLDLQRCGLGSSHVVALMEGTVENRTLCSLNISDNASDNAVMETIAVCLPKLKHLSNLEFTLSGSIRRDSTARRRLLLGFRHSKKSSTGNNRSH